MTQKLLYLDCPFEEYEDCKSLGGQWDPTLKCWYIRSGMDLTKFVKWLPLPDYLSQIDTSLVRLENSVSLKTLKSKIEHFNNYPLDLKMLMLNCMEIYEFGDCLGYVTPNDENKDAQKHIDDFFVDASVDLDVAIDNLHKKIILILKSQVSKLK
tara:strand:+ start:297 stop:758 length:462 start_codon:yes stop_codon:yes gene_type:complete